MITFKYYPGCGETMQRTVCGSSREAVNIMKEFLSKGLTQKGDVFAVQDKQDKRRANRKRKPAKVYKIGDNTPKGSISKNQDYVDDLVALSKKNQNIRN